MSRESAAVRAGFSWTSCCCIGRALNALNALNTSWGTDDTLYVIALNALERFSRTYPSPSVLRGRISSAIYTRCRLCLRLMAQDCMAQDVHRYTPFQSGAQTRLLAAVFEICGSVSLGRIDVQAIVTLGSASKDIAKSDSAIPTRSHPTSDRSTSIHTCPVQARRETAAAAEEVSWPPHQTQRNGLSRITFTSAESEGCVAQPRTCADLTSCAVGEIL